MPIIIQGIEGLKKLAGQNLGKSRWIEVAQDRISQFADVTEDWDWVHVDVEKAKTSPFKGTIAHGFLTMSLIIPMVHDIYKLEGIGIYGQMITLFTDCILQDRPPPTSLANGRHSVQVVNAIYQAARERRVVEVGT